EGLRTGDGGAAVDPPSVLLSQGGRPRVRAGGVVPRTAEDCADGVSAPGRQTFEFRADRSVPGRYPALGLRLGDTCRAAGEMRSRDRWPVHAASIGSGVFVQVRSTKGASALERPDEAALAGG